tara:strand:- start:358 stop:633 length:276 start_codon:yes stop_codon:yes gene_type:complete
MMTNKEKSFVISCIDFCQAHANMPDPDMMVANDIVRGLESEIAGNHAVSQRLRRASSIPVKLLNDYACRPVNVDWNRELKELKEGLDGEGK